MTQVDHGVLEMKTAIDRLQEQIEDIHRQIEEWVAFSVLPSFQSINFVIDSRATKITEQLRRKRKC